MTSIPLVVQATNVTVAPRFTVRDRLGSLNDLQCAYLLHGDEGSAFVSLLDLARVSSGSMFGFVAEVLQDDASAVPYLLTRALTDIAWDESSHLTFSRSTSGGMRFDNLDSLFGHVITTGQVVISNESVGDPRSAGTPAGHPRIESFLGLPVLNGGVLVGVIGLANRVDGYQPSDPDEMAPVTAAAGALIVHSRREQDRRRAESEMKNAQIRAEGAAAARGFFLSRMSHELRTPLNAMLGFAQLIQIRAQEDKDRRDAGRVVSAGRHLTALLDEVMDVSSIEEGRVTLQLQPANLIDAVTECLTLVEASAQERNVTLRLVPPSQTVTDLPITVDVDPSRLRQVILNLLDNAVKFNRPGGAVHIHVESLEGRVLLEVHDEGRGISELGRDRVFEPFERLDASALGIHGTGLGLSVARSLARAMGGEVQLVSSRPGHTVFRVTLRASDDSTARISEAESLVAVLDVSGTVLYVEDNPMNALLVRSILEHATPGVSVEVARTGLEALAILRVRTPDLILLDLHLPDMDGLDILAASDVVTRSAVHVVTADVTPAARERAAMSGTKGFLLKPVAPMDLVEVVVSTLRDQADPIADVDSR